MKTEMTFTSPAPLSQESAMAFWAMADEFSRVGPCRYLVVFDTDTSSDDIVDVTASSVEVVRAMLASFGFSHFVVEAIQVDRNG